MVRNKPGMAHYQANTSPYNEAWWWQHHAIQVFCSSKNWETSQNSEKMNATVYRDVLD